MTPQSILAALPTSSAAACPELSPVGECGDRQRATRAELNCKWVTHQCLAMGASVVRQIQSLSGVISHFLQANFAALPACLPLATKQQQRSH